MIHIKIDGEGATDLEMSGSAAALAAELTVACLNLWETVEADFGKAIADGLIKSICKTIMDETTAKKEEKK